VVHPITLNFVHGVADTIHEFGIDIGFVFLEIAEHAVAHDLETAPKALGKLKEVGVQIAIDDFGTGYAVLSRLRSLPVATLKIDTGFMHDLGTHAGDLAIVWTIIGSAEGVETPPTAMTLIQHGSHRVRGYLPSRPVPGTAMEALLSVRRMPLPFLADCEALSSGAI